MANPDHLNVLQQGVDAWNAWRTKNPSIIPDLSGANLSGRNLALADLNDMHLGRAYLLGANLSGANLSYSDLREANLCRTILVGANLLGAGLAYANLVKADLTSANLTGCRVYGVSAWELKLIRDVIDTITSKAVLILGRFTPERKQVLDALRNELRERNYLPIVFDFDKPASRNTDETITLLARVARFVIADVSDAKSILQELRAIVPEVPSVPVQPIIIEMQVEPGMFDFYQNFRSFLPAHRYTSQAQLLADLGDRVIRPAEAKVLELRGPTSSKQI